MTTLAPQEFQQYAEQVLQIGATKYGADSWKYGRHFSRVANSESVIRHACKAAGLTIKELQPIINSFHHALKHSDLQHTGFDEETGLLDMKHAGTRCFMQVYLLENSPGVLK